MAGNGMESSGWTVQRLLVWATQDFAKRGLPTARLDAELLLGQALGVERIRLFIEGDRALEDRELASFRALIQRRRAGEPVAYILGKREFYGLDFRVDSRVLIPRPDTETLVEVALQRTSDRSLQGQALDLCTGSGCVAIAFSRQRPTWQVIGIDLDSGAAELARHNALSLGAVHSVRFLVGDLAEPLDPEARFHLITANPPYVPTAEWQQLDTGIRDFEPRLALDGGPDGLGVIRRILEVATPRLLPSGILALEVGAGQAPEVAQHFEKVGFVDIERRRDYGGHERVVSGRWDPDARAIPES